MSYGIQKIGFYTPAFYVDLAELARARGVDPDKYKKGLGQTRMAFPTPDDDVVTMGCAAVDDLSLTRGEKESIDFLLFATETGVDASKAAGLYVHDLCDLPASCKVIEIKQACYGATAALELALSHARCHQGKRVLVIGSDISRYGLCMPGEPCQGAGAIAMLIGFDPSIIAFDTPFEAQTQNVMDFWRPVDQSEAIVDGKYSCMVYLEMLDKLVKGTPDYMCYHVPFAGLVEKAHKRHFGDVPAFLDDALFYAREIGNCYTASLYLSFLSLIEKSLEDLSGTCVGFYSYGSGAVASFFKGALQKNYKQLPKDRFSHRVALPVAEYEQLFKLPCKGVLPKLSKNLYRLSKIVDHKRIYGSS